jgi:NAD(P)-dependent dehydrogenase (short-subunit alcohol dehydrogenase family)
MDIFEGRVAVISGGASGIGLAMARRFAREGMHIALADVEDGALESAAKDLAARGARVLPVATDVSDAGSMQRLADRVATELGAVDLLCLNAGVSGGGGPIESLSEADWAWALNVNVWGVIHGLQSFLPAIKSRGEGHVVLTASVAGLTNSPQAAPYHATKHAVVSIAEVLHRELHDAASGVGVSCLCPGLVDTNFPTGGRNRPAQLQNPGADSIPQEQVDALNEAVSEVFRRGASPEHVADCVFAALQEGRFWIYTDEVHKDVIRARHSSIERGQNPPTDFNSLEGY